MPQRRTFGIIEKNFDWCRRSLHSKITIRDQFPPILPQKIEHRIVGLNIQLADEEKRQQSTLKTTNPVTNGAQAIDQSLDERNISIAY